MREERRRRRIELNRLLWMGCLCYVLTGFTLVIVGSVLPELLAFYAKDYIDGGLLVLIQFVGLLCGVLGMPVAIRLLGRRWTIVLGLLLLSIETCFLAFPPWQAVKPILFFAGFGAGLVEASIGSLVLLAVADRPALAMSRLEVTFGLGALAMPFLASWLIAREAWIYAFPVLGIGALLLAAVWVGLSFGALNGKLRKGRAEAEAGFASGDSGSTVKGGGAYVFMLCILFFSLYGGSEASIIHFLPSVFIEDRFASASVASLIVSVYWIGMVVGRAITGMLADRFGYWRFLLVSSAGAVVCLALLAASGGLWSGFALAFAVGLFMSGMFAIALIYANMQLPGHTDKTTSALMAVNGLGGALLPYLAGWTMETFRPEATVWLLTGCMALMFVFVAMTRLGPAFARQGQRTAGKEK